MTVLNVMIVEAEAHYREGLEEILKADGRVNISGVYGNARNALQDIAKAPPEVIFISLKLPGTNGLELASRISRVFGGVYIVLMSEDASFALESYEAGVSDYILKPFRLERVRKAIEKSMKGELT